MLLTRLHRTLLASLPVPFFGAFGTLMFLLLMQFLIRYLPELVGRGLPLVALAELIAYSLAYMVTLAVPMSVLIAMLAAFGRLAESRAYLVTKSAGVSLVELAWPAVLAGGLVGAGMLTFNHDVLPEANYRMASLWQDIRNAKPGFALEAGAFYTGIDGYAILAERAPAESNELFGVTVYDFTDHKPTPVVLTAARAELQSERGGLDLAMTLYGGEVHRTQDSREDGRRVERYERLAFERHRIRFDLSDLSFSRDDENSRARSDRTMPSSAMLERVDSLKTVAAERRAELRAELPLLGRSASEEPEPPREPTARLPADPSGAARDTFGLVARHPVLAGLAPSEQRAVYELAAQRARTLRSAADNVAHSVPFTLNQADKYRVEVYKKTSMAVACLVFALLGVPLGLSVPRRGVGTIGALAVGIFLFYWVTLVQGEKLSDRGLLPPWLGMWAANAIVGTVAVLFFRRETQDPARRDALRHLFRRKTLSG